MRNAMIARIGFVVSMLAVAGCKDGASGACSVDEDCAAGQVCDLGACRVLDPAECRTVETCLAMELPACRLREGATCREHRCQFPLAPPGEACYLEGQTDERRGRCLAGECVEPSDPVSLHFDAGLLSGSATFAGRVFVPLSPHATATVHEVDENSIAISNTLHDALYQRQLWPPAGETMSFGFRLPNGAYTVYLHNAETTAGAAAGSRVFAVRIDGNTVLEAWDIFADSGQPNRAVRRGFDVDVSSGELRVDFVPSGSSQPPKICGLEILPRGVPSLPLEDEGPECEEDADCGPDYTSLPTCLQGDVWADVHDFRCAGGRCIESITPVLQQACTGETTCRGGACVATGTTIAWQVHAAMGKGINAYGVVNDGSCALSASWDPAYFQRLAGAGFRHIRLVIYGFHGSQSPPYPLDPSTLANLKNIIDRCIEADLIPVLDYHSPAFMNDPTQAHKDRFVAHWGQLAEFFAGYPTMDLVFELTNEPIAPTGGVSFADWNAILAAALSAIRTYDAERVVLVSPGYWANVSGLAALELPADDSLMLSLHYYDPHTFTHQCCSWIEHYDECCGEEWFPIQEFRDEIARHFAPAIAYSAAHNLPVHIGEFGTYTDAPMASRARYLNYLARYFESVGFIWCHWDFFVDFHIFDRASDTFFPELLDALISAPMPSVWPSSRTSLYRSDFGSTTDGWTLETQNGASASLGVVGGELRVSIDAPGSDVWDIRLSRSTPLAQGRTYQLGWTVRSDGHRGYAAFRIGHKIPWVNLYDLSPSETSFLRSWTFSFLDQPSAVVSFGLGGDATDFFVGELDFSEISID